MSKIRMHQLMERSSALFRASLRQVASQYGLKLVQLEALVYLSSANRYSDTPAALSEYLGITKGTLSQTLKALQNHGLLTKQPDQADKRMTHCLLTDAGKEIAQQALPAPVFQPLPEEEAKGAEQALDSLLRALQKAHDVRGFGQCNSCSYYQPEKVGGLCGLTGEALSVPDSLKICREHTLSELD